MFALTERIGKEWPGGARITAVIASPQTTQLAIAAGLEIAELKDATRMEVAFDGADEVDAKLALVKGGGAALLPEKLVIAKARHVVIMVERNKIVERLGATRSLPVEVARFGWTTTRKRLLDLTDKAELRTQSELPIVTPAGNFIIDVSIPGGPLDEFATALKLTLGVVEHGLFLDQADEVIVGKPDGAIEILSRSDLD